MAAVTISPDTDETTPSAENGRPRRSSRLILWLAIAGLGFLLIVLIQISAAVKSDNTALESQIADIEATLTSTPKPQPANEALRAQFLQIQGQTSALQGVQPTLTAGHMDWLTILQTIDTFDPTQIALNGIAQSNSQIILTGQSIDENTVTAYAQTLTDSRDFKRVIVQSIILRNPGATAARGLADFTISLELGAPSPAAK